MESLPQECLGGAEDAYASMLQPCSSYTSFLLLYTFLQHTQARDHTASQACASRQDQASRVVGPLAVSAGQ
jgi:hypothetical protein